MLAALVFGYLAIPSVTHGHESSFEHGVALQEQGDDQGAIADFTKALALNPKNADAYYWRGRAKAYLGDYQGALEDLRRAVGLDSNNARSYQLRGWIRWNLGEYEGAVADATQALTLDPRDIKAYRNRGWARERLGDHAGADRDYKQVLALDPRNAEEYIGRASVKGKLRDPQGALADLTQALTTNPKYVDAYVKRAWAKGNLGDHQGAVADATQALTINPQYVDAYVTRAGARADLRDYQGAMEDATHALTLDPTHVGGYLKRALAKGNLGDHQGAVADATQALTLNPRFLDAYLLRAWQKGLTGDHQGVVEDVTQAIKLDPKNVDAYNRRAWAKEKLGDHQGAVEDATQALTLNPNTAKLRAETYIFRAESRGALGDHKGAIDDALQAIQIDPSNSRAYGALIAEPAIGLTGTMLVMCCAAGLFFLSKSPRMVTSADDGAMTQATDGAVTTDQYRSGDRCHPGSASSPRSVSESIAHHEKSVEPEPVSVGRVSVPYKLSFHGNGGELFGIFIFNLLKSLGTLGIYSFWGKVKTRQYLWRQSEFAGDRFSYHGTGKELLIGWLRAMLCFGSIMGAQAVLPLVWDHVVAQVLAGGIIYGGLAVLIPLARIGTMRYRLSRTAWRGIRFSFRGHFLPFFWLSLRGYLLTVLTFGFYYPYFHLYVRRFMVENSAFGSAPFKFDTVGPDMRDLWKRYAVSLGISMVFLPIGFLMSFGSLQKSLGVAGIPLAVVCTLIIYGCIWLPYLAARRRFYWNHTRVGGGKFRSSVDASELFRLYGENFLLAIASLGLALPWIKIRTMRYDLEHLALQGAEDLSAIMQDAQQAASTGDELAGFLDFDALPG
jgi:uncharacterized membrane protein YjgN (DUF898 family)/tetratricopeptide (TPR) repeat protein